MESDSNISCWISIMSGGGCRPHLDAPPWPKNIKFLRSDGKFMTLYTVIFLKKSLLFLSLILKYQSRSLFS